MAECGASSPISDDLTCELSADHGPFGHQRTLPSGCIVSWSYLRDWRAAERSADRAAAEERGRAEGRQWAIDTLRDGDAYHRHQQETGVYDGGRQFLADWLEAMAPGADT